MAGQNRINFQVGFNIDKAGLSEMQSLFQNIVFKAAEPGNKLNAGLQQAAKTANTLDNILSKTFNTELGSLNVVKFNKELEKSGLTLKTIQSDFAKIGSQGADAYNRLAQAVLGTNQQLRQSSKILDKMFTSIKNVFQYNISATLFNSLTGAIEEAYTYSKKLDTSLNDIRIVTDKSADNMAKFAKEANEASKAMGASTLDYTNASLIYYQQGLSDAEVKARTETTIKAANVTGQTGEEVSEQLTAVWNGYKVTAAETELYVDKLAAVAATTAADLEELSTGMSKVASAANAMGVDFDDLNAQIATIVSVTRQAPESVGTALKTIYARLGDLKVDGVDEFGVSLGQVSQQLTQMGIQILDQQGNLRDMSSVIADVAKQWTTWTEAQKQAAAIAMAGKRQYNNLIALFENWDMYTDALNTSTDAMGTLQHQQDIYMESTAAKLKTLKAAWQGLYDDAINQDEVNAGIEALTNLVEVFDNLIDSFGGGIKAVAGFGAIISSVFNKQIINSINSINQRIEVFKNNLALTEAKMQVAKQGVAQSGNSPESIANAENTKTQLNYAKQIYEVRAGLNEEQAISLIEQQKEIGNLVEQKVLLEERAQRDAKKVLDQEQINEMMKVDLSTAEDINAQYYERAEKLNIILADEERIEQILDKQKHQYINAEDAKKEIIALTTEIGIAEGSQQKRNLDALLKQQTSMDKLYNSRASILKIIKQSTAEAYKNVDQLNKEADAAEKLFHEKEKINEINTQIKNKEIEINKALEQGAKGAGTAQRLTTITSALGNMAMAWSSVNSLIDTWNDKEASFGDKAIQSLMTLGFSLPIVANNFSQLNEIFEFGTVTLDSFVTTEEAATAVSAAHALSIEAETAMREAQQLEDQESLFAEEMLTAAFEQQTIAQTAEAAATEMSNLAKEQSIITSKGNIIAKYKEVVAILAHKSALDADTQALFLNKMMAMSAVAAGAVLITSFIALGAVIDNIKNKTLEANKALIDENNKKQQEANQNKELIKSYNELIKTYDEGNISRKETSKQVENLCDKYDIENGKILALSGQYDKLTESIRNARKEELAEQKEIAKDSINLALSNARTKAGDFLHTSSNKAEFNYGEVYDELGGYYLGPEFRLVGDLTSEQGLLSYYNQLIAKRKEYQNLGNNSAVDAINKEIEKYKEEFDVIISNIELLSQTTTEEGFLNAEDIFSNEKLDYKEFLSNYENIINSVKETLDESLGAGTITQEQYNNALKNSKKYLDELINQYDKASNLLIQKEITDANKILQFIDFATWSDEDKALVFSGLISFDGIENEEDVKKAVELLKKQLNVEDLNLIGSLREKISSTKKLTSKEIKEAAGEESTLAKDYELELSDFDNQSQLKQVETLNKIVEEKININKEYIESIKKAKEQEKELLELRKANLQKELEDLQKIPEDVLLADPSIKDRIEEVYKLIAGIDDELDNIDPFSDIDDINFDNITNGLQGVVSIAEVLRDLAEDVGEQWTIAADSIQHFGENFPELLEDQTNYNILQDGSLQLTKQGQQALQELVQERSNDLKLQSEAYALELQKQIDIQKATAEYYTQQADALENYLQAEGDAKETEAKLEENLTNYKTELSQIVGANDEELNTIIQENLGLTNENAFKNTKDIYDYWLSVGGAAAAASEAYASGQFNPPSFKGGTNVGNKGANVKHFEGKATSDVKLERLSSDQIEELIQSYRTQAEKASNRAAELIGQKVGLESSTQAALHSLENIAAGKAGKDSKSSSSKDKSKDIKKDEFDRYWELKKAIDAVDHSISKLRTDEENLHGRELIKALKEENKLLENQAQLYRKLADEQEKEAIELRGKLSAMGLTFDESGMITNYAAATSQALAEYNAAITQYNAGAINDDSLKIYEKAYDDFKTALERYDTLFYSEMVETQDKIDELLRKERENVLKSWETDIQFRLDTKQLKRDWNDFFKEIEDDFKSVYKDLRVGLKTSLADASTYVGDTGTITTILNAVKDVNREIDVLMGGGKSTAYESVSQAQEKLKELNTQLMDSAKNLRDLWKEAWQTFLDGIDQVGDKFEDLKKQFENINDELDFQRQLIGLIYGDEAYSLMGKYYEGQQRANSNMIESTRIQRDMWKQLFEESGATLENQASWTEEQSKYYEKMVEAQKELNDLTIKQIELLQNEYKNAVDGIILDLEKALNGGRRLEDVKTQWERITADSDKYYDNVEGLYHIQTLMNKYSQSIADTADLKAQQKLNDLRERELKYLREKENLTEYDIKAANLRYELALKQIALEESQNNKTSMKLTRNEQGNWAYQYVADEEDVMSKRQELLDTWNELYQLADQAYQKNLDSMQSLNETYLNKLAEIEELALTNKELANERRAELDEWYFEQYALLAEENALYRDDLMTASSGLLQELYQQDVEAFGNRVETERELAEELVSKSMDEYWQLKDAIQADYDDIGSKANEIMTETRADWTSTAQSIIEQWDKSGDSVKNIVLNAYKELGNANSKYQTAVDELQRQVNRDFGDTGITGSIRKATDATDNLTIATQELRNWSEQYLYEIRCWVNNIESAWVGVKNSIRDAITEIEIYIRKVGEVGQAQQRNADIGNYANSLNTITGNGGSGGGSNLNSNNTISAYTVRDANSGEVVAYSLSDSGRYSMINSYDDQYYDDSVKKETLSASDVAFAKRFSTGGYTGEWDDSGRIAILHQKELVLNQDDTSNFLAGINTIRDLANMNGSIEKSIMQAVLNTASQLGNMKSGTVISGGNVTSSNDTSNVFNITAEFPNANNVEEIREAILSLPNYASQFVNTNMK